MKNQDVTIALEDTSAGYEISPARVPMAVLAEFSGQVRDFLKGSSGDIDIDATDVAIEKGSLALRAQQVSSPRLIDDLSRMLTGSDIALLDKKRRGIIKQWQDAAKRVPGRSIKIASRALNGIVRISATTTYYDSSVRELVEVERYIRGELYDLGGKNVTNAHIKLPDGTTLTVRSDRSLVSAEQKNRLYKTVHVRIKAKLDLDTGELTDAVLIEFVNYEPRFDEQEFRDLTSRGQAAWGGIDDAAKWVNRLRGEG